jgi:MYXO-CTERM domain-containing protein
MVVLERESMLRHPLMVALAGVSTLSLTTAATADLANDRILFQFQCLEFGTFVTECDVEYDAITGDFSDFTITDVAAETYFDNPSWRSGKLWRSLRVQVAETLSCTIQLDVEGYGPMRIDLEGVVLFSAQLELWEGDLYGTYGPDTPFGAGESFTGDWSARVVPAPGALALLGVAGLAGRRRRD